MGFRCPVPNCGNPYLYWHHFDPVWEERQHHEPEGMVALCAIHHAKADAGAFTKEQLRDFKKRGRQSAEEIKGRFDWMRRGLLAVVGGNFYLETPTILEFRGSPVIWFNHDDNGYLLLNLRMLTTSDEPRAHIEDNCWLALGTPADVQCPPHGRLLHLRYPNGDELKVEFFDLQYEDFGRRYPGAHPQEWGLAFPITAVEIQGKVGGTNIEFGPRDTALGGLYFKDCFFRGNPIALSVG